MIVSEEAESEGSSRKGRKRQGHSEREEQTESRWRKREAEEAGGREKTREAEIHIQTVHEAVAPMSVSINGYAAFPKFAPQHRSTAPHASTTP